MCKAVRCKGCGAEYPVSVPTGISPEEAATLTPLCPACLEKSGQINLFADEVRKC